MIIRNNASRTGIDIGPATPVPLGDKEGIFVGGTFVDTGKGSSAPVISSGPERQRDGTFAPVSGGTPAVIKRREQWRAAQQRRREKMAKS